MTADEARAFAGLALAAAGKAGATAWEQGPVYAAARRGGRRLADGWADDGDLVRLLSDLARDAGPRGRPDAFEICLTHGFRALGDGGRGLADVRRGVVGVIVEATDGAGRRRHARFAPSLMIARNLGFRRVLEGARDLLQVPTDAALRVTRFHARQVLLRTGPPPLAEALTRGQAVVPIAAIDPAMLVRMAREMGGWLVRHVGADGRLPYKYWPSRGRWSTANNTVRQALATVALGRFAAWSGRAEDAAAAARNRAWIVDTWLKVSGDGIGTIYDGVSAKLGAAALVALALLEAPDPGAHGEAYRALCRGVDALWRPDGSFRTFHRPAERNDNQNFYPGETALFWASRVAREGPGDVLERLRRTLEHYREWHLANRNPAFVPWHTQARAALFDATGEQDLLPFLFEMSDWLLAMQQVESAPADELRGRFYDPARRDFGPPHASSTGVYLEGLADAFRLAVARGDAMREAAYGRAIRWGLRSLRQLQFRDEADMFYVSRRARVAGALRTETYDNTIRVDNVQHALMAVLKLIPQADRLFRAPS